MTILLTTSRRNGHKIKANGYYFTIRRRNRDHIVWACRSEGCTAIGRTDLDESSFISSFTLMNSVHNHESNVFQERKEELFEQMKRLVIDTNGSNREIIGRVLRGLPREDIILFKNHDTLNRYLRSHRNESLNPGPFIYPTLGLGEHIVTTHTGEPFYQYGPDNYDDHPVYENFIIFFSPSGKAPLHQNHKWSIDGTFFVAPRPYVQFITISYMLEWRVIPCIFALVKNKQQETYEELLEIINLLGEPLTPEYVKLDFEKSLINAVVSTYSDARISGCLFHLGQAIQRKVQSLGYMGYYRTNRDFKFYIRALCALSYVPIELVHNLFDQLMDDEDFPPACEEIYAYFYDTYIDASDRSGYRVEYWNSLRAFTVNGVVRTNNGKEGWHNILNRCLRNKMKSFIVLVSTIRDEEEQIRQKRIYCEDGIVVSRKKKYIVMENNVREFLRQHNNVINNVETLKELTSLLYY